MISIVLCTANRAEALSQTLRSLNNVICPDWCEVELVLVDNASTDETPHIARRFAPAWGRLVYVYEARKGKGFAYNAGLDVSRGDVMLFTDDDVRFPESWISDLSEPLMDGAWDGVAGGFTTAPALIRNWMSHSHAHGPNDSSFMAADGPGEMIGLNMAISRRVLEKVPRFDVELGPGALGLGDDTLFSHQVLAAGFKVAVRKEVTVEHCFDPARLKRSALLRRAEAVGRSRAYIDYHWNHAVQPLQYLRLLRSLSVLQYLRLVRKRECLQDEGLAQWEHDWTTRVAYRRQFLKESRKSRNYSSRGLTKLTGVN